MNENRDIWPQTELPFMNNFYAYLPGGWLREYYDQSPEKRKLMDAIDKLLIDEFPDINGHKIAEDMIKANRLIQPSGENITSDEARKQFKEAEEKLRPLFNRLLELGFDKGLMEG